MEPSLTPEQKARIEHNRRLALEKRAARLAQIAQATSPKQCPQGTKPNTPSAAGHSSLVQLNKSSSQLNQHVEQNSSIKPSIGHRSTVNNISISNPKPLTSTSNCMSTNSSVINKPTISNQSSTNPGLVFQSKINFSHPDKDSKYSTLDLLKSKSPQKNPGSNQSTSLARPTSCTTNFPVKPQTRTIGKCILLSEERFTVDIPYQPQATDIFRTINGKEYDSKTKNWTFPLSEYFNLRKAVSALKPFVIINDLPKWIIETFITKAKIYQLDPSKVDISRIDPKLKDALYPFQKEGIQYGVSRKGRCLIADDMGLGKSIQALGIADYYRQDWPLLIVCPSSMRYQWEEEVRVRLPNSVPTYQVFVMTSGKDIVDGATVLILSYDLLAKKKDLIKEMKFGVVIMDESHIIKGVKTQRGKAALEIAQQCSRVILLSGTPILSRPMELYNQIKAIDPTLFPFFKEYGMRYCDGQQNQFGWDFNGSSNMEELSILLKKRLMIRRMKSEVLRQLPDKIRQVITLNSRSVTKNSESMDAFAMRLQNVNLRGSERHSCLLQYFSETAKTKAPAVCEYITDVLQDNRKFLCFAHHGDMLDAICETLEKNKTFYIRIDGSVSAEDRKNLCDKFQYEDKWMVAVLSIKAANTGLTLTAAQMVIFAELFWNPGDLAQAEDRVHRIGQEDCVVVKYLIAKGTADDYLWPLVQSKLEVLNKAGLSKDSYMDADHKSLVAAEEKKETQTKIDDFFQNEEDDDLLLSVMDEVDGVIEKRMKFS